MTIERKAMRLTLRTAASVLLILTSATLFPANGVAGQAEAPPAQTAAPFDPAATISLEDLKADLDVLWAVLEEGHGGFDRYTPLETLKKSFEALKGGLAGPLPVLDLYARLMPFVAEIKDGHTRLSLPADASEYLDARPIYFPVGLRLLGDRAYVLRDLSADRAFGEGAEILSIDGRPFRDILAALLPLVPADAGIRTARLKRLEPPGAFGRMLALWYGPRESFRVRFRPYRGTEAKEIAAAGITAADLGRLLKERYPASLEPRPTYELAFRGPVAVMTIRAFGDDPDKTRPRFPDFLTQAFLTMEEKKTPALVIDLRGNGGGFDEYGKFLFAHVMDRPFLYYWALEAKKDRYDLFRYTDETPSSAEELANPLQKNARGWFDVLGHPNRGLQSTRKPHFAGRVAILIDGGSFSATGETTSAFHYYKKAVFFGEEGGAGYYGNTSGFMVTATLPHSRIQVRVPLVLYTMAVEGYPKDRGLVPDVPAAPTIEDLVAGRDPVMERALAWLEKK